MNHLRSDAPVPLAPTKLLPLIAPVVVMIPATR
jgi:hypothetical protein